MNQERFYFDGRYLFLILFCLISGWSWGQLTPNFSADVVEGCTPKVIKFTNLTTGNATSYWWDLGNGITSVEKNPTTLYFDGGTYTVTLLAINGKDTQSVVKKDYIVIHDLPTVDFKV